MLADLWPEPEHQLCVFHDKTYWLFDTPNDFHQANGPHAGHVEHFSEPP